MDDVRENERLFMFSKPKLLKPINKDDFSSAYSDGKLHQPDSKQCVYCDNQQSTVMIMPNKVSDRTRFLFSSYL